MSGPYGGGVAGERLHLEVSGRTHRELGLSRGRALRSSLGAAYERYAALFRAVGVPEDAEQDGVERAAAAIAGWRPAVLEELAGVAEGAGVEVEQVIALNARTEILAARSSHECSALTALIDGRRYGAQTWDWHIELDGCWHTHEVAGPPVRRTDRGGHPQQDRSQRGRPRAALQPAQARLGLRGRRAHARAVARRARRVRHRR